MLQETWISLSNIAWVFAEILICTHKIHIRLQSVVTVLSFLGGQHPHGNSLADYG